MLTRRHPLENADQLWIASPPPPVARALLPNGDDNTCPEESPQQGRLSALHRLAPPSEERVPLLRNGAANSDSGRLQEVEIQFLEDDFPTHILHSGGMPSSSRLPAKDRLSLPQVSPIRTLSEDRRVLATGLTITVHDEEDQSNQELPLVALPKQRRNNTSTKASGKRKAPETQAVKPQVKRVARSTLQGVSLKKRRLTRAQISPRRNSPRNSPQGKQISNEAAADTSDPSLRSRTKKKQNVNPPITLIPAMTRQGTDFRSGRTTLP